MRTVKHALVLMTTTAQNVVKIINWQMDSVYQNVGLESFIMVIYVLNAIILVLLVMEEKIFNVIDTCMSGRFI